MFVIALFFLVSRRFLNYKLPFRNVFKDITDILTITYRYHD